MRSGATNVRLFAHGGSHRDLGETHRDLARGWVFQGPKPARKHADRALAELAQVPGGEPEHKAFTAWVADSFAN